MEIKMRNKLQPYLHREVQFKAKIKRFDNDGVGKRILLLRSLMIDEEVVADHIWLRKGLPECVENFRKGDWITFQATVHEYERLFDRSLDYGIKDPRNIQFLF